MKGGKYVIIKGFCGKCDDYRVFSINQVGMDGDVLPALSNQVTCTTCLNHITIPAFEFTALSAWEELESVLIKEERVENQESRYERQEREAEYRDHPDDCKCTYCRPDLHHQY
jgi:hypothetical protein